MVRSLLLLGIAITAAPIDASPIVAAEGRVAIMLLAHDGQPVSDVEFRLRSFGDEGDGETLSAAGRTDEDGRCEIANVPAGTYRLVPALSLATAAGLTDETALTDSQVLVYCDRQFAVREDDRIDVTFTLPTPPTLQRLDFASESVPTVAQWQAVAFPTLPDDRVPSANAAPTTWKPSATAVGWKVKFALSDLRLHCQSSSPDIAAPIIRLRPAFGSNLGESWPEYLLHADGTMDRLGKVPRLRDQSIEGAAYRDGTRHAWKAKYSAYDVSPVRLPITTYATEMRFGSAMPTAPLDTDWIAAHRGSRLDGDNPTRPVVTIWGDFESHSSLYVSAGWRQLANCGRPLGTGNGPKLIALNRDGSTTIAVRWTDTAEAAERETTLPAR